jgi:hypothetical protein
MVKSGHGLCRTATSRSPSPHSTNSARRSLTPLPGSNAFRYSFPMPPRVNRRTRGVPRRRARRRPLTSFSRFARRRWRELRLFLRAWWKSTPALRLVVGVALAVVLWLTVNWIYHAVTKPTEILFPLDTALDKNAADTWHEYGSLFREHATAAITPELLAALAQVEGAGNPVARTYWRWRLTWNPFAVYQPASSAVGMFQITDGTFQEAKHYCVHDHVVVEDGPWHAWRSCWFNSLYSRVLPSHAIEMTAAYLDRRVARALAEQRRAAATLRQKQDLAAVIHLCGAGAGRTFVTGGFRFSAREHCGDHDAGAYLAKVNAMKRQFARLAAGGRLDRLVTAQ